VIVVLPCVSSWRQEFSFPNLDPKWRPGEPLAGRVVFARCILVQLLCQRIYARPLLSGRNDGHLTWKDIAWLKTLTDLPIVVRGVHVVSSVTCRISSCCSVTSLSQVKGVLDPSDVEAAVAVRLNTGFEQEC
jgi:hypothetical protein